MADHKIDGNEGAGNADLIRRIDAMQACQVGHSDEWSKATKYGYNQMVDAATAAGVVVWWDNEAQEIKMAVTVQEAARVLLDAFMRKDIDPLDAVDPQIEALAIKHSGNRGDPVIQLEIAEEFFCAALRSIAASEA